MDRGFVLRLGATAVTVAGLLLSAGYVARHPKDEGAPLQPPVAHPAATIAPARPTGRIQIQPGVRATDLPAVTGTHVS